jgi:glycerol-3-phosphate dehydrogenase
LEVRASVVVNATGPWVDVLLEGLEGIRRPTIGGTKGVHVVVDYRDRGPLHAIYAEARRDHRPFFVIPWRGKHLVGTTDTRFHGPPDDVRADPLDVSYLLDEAASLLPAAPLAESDVLYAYAGVRPLPAVLSDDAGAITRRHIIHDHAGEGHPGLLSIIGGKLSTYRSLASQTIDRIEHQLRELRVPHVCADPSMKQPADERAPAPMSDDLRRLNPPLLDYLRSLYGPRIAAIGRLLEERPTLAAPLCPHGPDLEAQVVLAAREELAISLANVLLRRTGIGWNVCHGLDCSRRAAALLAKELGWQRERIAAEVARYATEIGRAFTIPAHAQRALAVDASLLDT